MCCGLSTEIYAVGLLLVGHGATEGITHAPGMGSWVHSTTITENIKHSSVAFDIANLKAVHLSTVSREVVLSMQGNAANAFRSQF